MMRDGIVRVFFFLHKCVFILKFSSYSSISLTYSSLLLSYYLSSPFSISPFPPLSAPTLSLSVFPLLSPLSAPPSPPFPPITTPPLPSSPLLCSLLRQLYTPHLTLLQQSIGLAAIWCREFLPCGGWLASSSARSSRTSEAVRNLDTSIPLRNTFLSSLDIPEN